MKPTSTCEKGLESIIFASLVNDAGYIQGDSNVARWANKVLHRTTIPLRSIAAGELGR